MISKNAFYSFNSLLAYIFAMFLAWISFVSPAGAATMFMDPSKSDYQPGDIFTVKLRLDSQKTCINAVEAFVVFSDNLSFVDFSTANSVFPLWISRPAASDQDSINYRKEFSFSAGTPGGFCGAIAGDVGASDIMAEAVFKILENSDGNADATIDFKDGSSALLNDGQGTAAELFLSNAHFGIYISDEKLKDDWSQRVKDDTMAPENFVIEIQKDPALFEGEYFVVFSTTDKQSGIDHYEIIEAEPGYFDSQKSLAESIGGLLGINEPKWEIAATPYRLRDQSMQSMIIVKAVDKAGNSREVKYLPETKPVSANPWVRWALIAILLIALLAAGVLAVKTIKLAWKKQ